jgi:D-arabinose 1-dehydrogenase-like Zn-dependent alcohol dehydrogenase
MFNAGDLVPIVDRIHPLREIPEALRRMGEDKAKGKIVITMKRSL